VALTGGLGLGAARGQQQVAPAEPTGRTIPANLKEQLAMQQVKSNPAAGRQAPIKMNDPRWPGPTRIAAPFDHADWLFELKHDGFRALAYIESGACRLISRKQIQYKRFATLCTAMAALPVS